MIPLVADLTVGYNLIYTYSGTITTNTTTDGAAVDLLDYDGPVHLLAILGDCGNGTITFNLTECATSGGTYTAVTGATKALAASATANDNSAHMIKIDNRAQRYVKGQVVTGSGITSCPVALAVLGRKKVGGGSGVKTT